MLSTCSGIEQYSERPKYWYTLPATQYFLRKYGHDEWDGWGRDGYEFGSNVQNLQPGAGTRLLVHHFLSFRLHGPLKDDKFLPDLVKVSSAIRLR